MDSASYAILLYPEEKMQFGSTLTDDVDVHVEVGFSEGIVPGWFGWSKTQGSYYRITEDSEDSVSALALYDGLYIVFCLINHAYILFFSAVHDPIRRCVFIVQY